MHQTMKPIIIVTVTLTMVLNIHLFEQKYEQLGTQMSV